MSSSQLSEKLELLNALWRRVRVIPEIMRLAHETYMVSFGVPEGDRWRSPFNEVSDLRDTLEKVRKELIDRVVELVLTVDNVKVNHHEVYYLLPEGEFDAFRIAEHIEKNYLSKADELALENIISGARDLLPWEALNAMRDGRHSDAVESILKKRRLELRHNIYLGYSSPHTVEFCDRASNLFKLAKIVLHGIKPSKARGEEAYHAYWNATYGDLFEKKKFYGPIIATRVYKNGKFVCWFKSEEDAKKVAEALVHGGVDVEIK